MANFRPCSKKYRSKEHSDEQDDSEDWELKTNNFQFTMIFVFVGSWAIPGNTFLEIVLLQNKLVHSSNLHWEASFLPLEGMDVLNLKYYMYTMYSINPKPEGLHTWPVVAICRPHETFSIWHDDTSGTVLWK